MFLVAAYLVSMYYTPDFYGAPSGHHHHQQLQEGVHAAVVV
jgi:hypothetical protein